VFFILYSVLTLKIPPPFRHNVMGLVSGVSGACYARHGSRASAQAAFANALANNQVHLRI
jgi:hypothetical protein